MPRVPTTPTELFTEYLPERFAGMKAALGGRTSPGAMVFHVTDPGGPGERWSVRIVDGELGIAPDAAADPIVQITTARDDFQHLMLQAVRLGDVQPGRPEAQLLAFKALFLDAERLAMVRSVTGSVAFVVTDGGVKRRIVVTPGAGIPNVEHPECRLECQASDFLDLQLGKQQPMQLAMSGKMRIVGDARIAMALTAVLS